MNTTPTPRLRSTDSRLLRRPVVALLSLLIAFGSWAGTAWADTPFGETVDVRLVNLEVVVTEKGERVHGLGPDDFVLTVDGQEMPIDFFTEVAGGTAIRTMTSEDAPAPAVLKGEPVPTSYLVFIDEFFSDKIDRDRTLKAMIDQLPSLVGGDRMAVVAYNGNGVDMLADWTGDIGELTNVLSSATQRRSLGLEWGLEEKNYEGGRQRRIRDEAFIAGAGRRSYQPGDPLNPLAVGLSIEERQFADRIENATERAVDAAAATLRGFSQPNGRKVMLLLAGGWPSEAARWVAPEPSRAEDRNRLLQGRALLEPLVETANLLGYSIYPVDVPGIDSLTIGADTGSVAEQEALRERSQFREQEEELALLELAQETGGEAYLDGSRDNALGRVVSDTRSYYWLGFSPTWQENDSRHDVRVKLRDKGLKVRARRSFTDLSQSSKVTMLTESTLLFRDAPDILPLTASFGASEKAGIGKREIPLSVDIPVDHVTFLPTPDGYQADLELRVAVIDENGNRADVPVTPISYKTERLPEKDEVATYETRVKMRKMRHDVVVSLYDRLSGKLLSTRLTAAKL